MILQAFRNARCREGDFSGDKILASSFGFMVEQDTVDGKHVVSIAIFLDDPVTVLFGDGIRAVGIKRRFFILRDFYYLAVQLGGRSLVDFDLVGHPKNANGFQNAQNADGVHFTGIFRRIEGNLYVGLRREIVDFIGLCEGNNTNQRGRIGQISVVERNPVLL